MFPMELELVDEVHEHEEYLEVVDHQYLHHYLDFYHD